jgi:hypothetical protein
VGGVAEVLQEYWTHKKWLSRGANPEPEIYRQVAKHLEKLLAGYVSSPFTEGVAKTTNVPTYTFLQSLAGAGGGGFMVAIVKDGLSSDAVDEAVQELGAADPDLACSSHKITVDSDGICVTLNGKEVNL